jgi:hypothetical protein
MISTFNNSYINLILKSSPCPLFLHLKNYFPTAIVIFIFMSSLGLSYTLVPGFWNPVKPIEEGLSP